MKKRLKKYRNFSIETIMKHGIRTEKEKTTTPIPIPVKAVTICLKNIRILKKNGRIFQAE